MKRISRGEMVAALGKAAKLAARAAGSLSLTIERGVLARSTMATAETDLKNAIAALEALRKKIDAELSDPS